MFVWHGTCLKLVSVSQGDFNALNYILETYEAHVLYKDTLMGVAVVNGVSSRDIIVYGVNGE